MGGIGAISGGIQEINAWLHMYRREQSLITDHALERVYVPPSDTQEIPNDVKPLTGFQKALRASIIIPGLILFSENLVKLAFHTTAFVTNLTILALLSAIAKLTSPEGKLHAWAKGKIQTLEIRDHFVGSIRNFFQATSSALLLIPALGHSARRSANIAFDTCFCRAKNVNSHFVSSPPPKPIWDDKIRSLIQDADRAGGEIKRTCLEKRGVVSFFVPQGVTKAEQHSAIEKEKGLRKQIAKRREELGLDASKSHINYANLDLSGLSFSTCLQKAPYESDFRSCDLTNASFKGERRPYPWLAGQFYFENTILENTTFENCSMPDHLYDFLREQEGAILKGKLRIRSTRHTKNPDKDVRKKAYWNNRCEEKTLREMPPDTSQPICFKNCKMPESVYLALREDKNVFLKGTITITVGQ